MSSFVILTRARWGEKLSPLTQVQGTEQRAVNIAQDVYRKYGLDRAVVLDADYKIKFKIDRRCRCTNAQYEIDGRLRCQSCKRVITEQRITIEEMSK